MVSAYGRDTAGRPRSPGQDAGPRTRSALRNLMTDLDIAPGLRTAGTYCPAARSPRALPASCLRSCCSVARSTGTAAWTGRRRPTSSSWAQNRTRSSMTLSTNEATCLELATMSTRRTSAPPSPTSTVYAPWSSPGTTALPPRMAGRACASGGHAQALGLDTRDMNRKFQRGKNLPSLEGDRRGPLRRPGTRPSWALTAFNLAGQQRSARQEHPTSEAGGRVLLPRAGVRRRSARPPPSPRRYLRDRRRRSAGHDHPDRRGPAGRGPGMASARTPCPAASSMSLSLPSRLRCWT
jgi:hypothetical protein